MATSPTRAELAEHIAESQAAMLAALTPLVAQAFAAGLSSEAGRVRDDARQAAWDRSLTVPPVTATVQLPSDEIAAAFADLSPEGDARFAAAIAAKYPDERKAA